MSSRFNTAQNNSGADGRAERMEGAVVCIYSAAEVISAVGSVCWPEQGVYQGSGSVGGHQVHASLLGQAGLRTLGHSRPVLQPHLTVSLPAAAVYLTMGLPAASSGQGLPSISTGCSSLRSWGVDLHRGRDESNTWRVSVAGREMGLLYPAQPRVAPAHAPAPHVQSRSNLQALTRRSPSPAHTPLAAQSSSAAAQAGGRQGREAVSTTCALLNRC